MKILFILMMFCVSGAFAAIPDSAEDWYQPDDYSFTGADATWTKNGKSYGATIDKDGNIKWQQYPNDRNVQNALEYALSAYANSMFNKDEIETLGENLHKVFSTDGITITGETPDGSTQSYTIRFKSGIGESGTIQGETEHMKWNLADEKSLELLDGNKIQIKGWKDADGSSSIFEENNLGLVARTPGNDLIYRAWYGVDNLSLAPSSTSKKLQLNQWDTAPDNGLLPLAEALAKERKDVWSNYKLVVRNSSKGMNYVDIGTLPIGGGAPVDGTSITTNTSDGATVQGEASLYGWASADDMGVPYKTDGKLSWKAAEEWVDGTSIAWAATDSGLKYEVKDAHIYAGKHSKHYFGTGSDKSAPLGWHELPNATTNRVEGDERTISSNANVPGMNPDPDVKTLGLIGWNYNYTGEDPVFLVNQGGALNYIPLPAITNLAACACTNKWENLVGWLEDGQLVEDGIQFGHESLDEYLYNGLGYIYSTTPDNLHFNNDGEQIKASFTAPENWADGLSLNLTDDGKYQIYDYAKSGACGASVSAMLSDPKGSDATTHLLLAKKTDDGSLHYVPFGEGIAGGGEHADGVTITTNTTEGAATQGLMSLYGWSSAADGKVLMKKDGKVAWEDVGYTAGSGVQLTGEATNVIEHNFIAGAGISLLPAESGTAVTIATATPTAATPVDPHLEEITFITEVWYDATTHKIKAKRKTAKVMVAGSVSTAEEFDVVTCTAHSDEHQSTSE